MKLLLENQLTLFNILADYIETPKQVSSLRDCCKEVHEIMKDIKLEDIFYTPKNRKELQETIYKLIDCKNDEILRYNSKMHRQSYQQIIKFGPIQSWYLKNIKSIDNLMSEHWKDKFGVKL